MPRWDPAERAAHRATIIGLWANDYSMVQICRHLGHSRRESIRPVLLDTSASKCCAIGSDRHCSRLFAWPVSIPRNVAKLSTPRTGIAQPAHHPCAPSRPDR
jgi:hypothetical protein